MYEVIPPDKPGAPRRVRVCCAGLKSDGAVCRKLLAVLHVPKRESIASAAKIELKCRHCDARNLYRVQDVVSQ